MLTRHDRERWEKKRINGPAYDSDSTWGWVGGRCRRLGQTDLGKPGAILHAVEGRGPPPLYAAVLHCGLRATLAKAWRLATGIAKVDAHCPKRQQGLRVGTSLALAALNRALEPLSTRALCDWWATPPLRRHVPHASQAAVASQRLWDPLDRLDPPTPRALWQDIMTAVIARAAIPLEAVCEDGTNFSPFMETLHARCDIATRGPHTQGRSHVRQVRSALLCPAERQVPLYEEVDDGNRHETKPCPVMRARLHHVRSDSGGETPQSPPLPVLCATGNHAQEHFRLLDTRKLPEVGARKRREVTDLADLSHQDARWSPCHTLG